LCKQTNQHETFNRLKHYAACNCGRFLFCNLFNQLFKFLIMNNSQLCHNWANKIKSSGKGSSMFYEGDSIYSYGYHFKIAKFFKDVNNEDLILFTTRSYSNTTAKHKGHVLRAIPSNITVIHCYDVDPGFYGHKSNILQYLNNCKQFIKKAEKSIYYKTDNLAHAISQYEQCKKYIFSFGLNIKDFNSIELQSDDPEYTFNQCSELISDFQNSDKYKKWLIDQEIKAKKLEAEQIIKNAENIDKFRNFQISTVNGISSHLLRYNAETNNIETSGGVKMPVNEFKRAFNLFKNGLIRIGDKIEHYVFNGENDNFIKVGCHKIERNEIFNLANQIS
jgi:hypothetical protein